MIESNDPHLHSNADDITLKHKNNQENRLNVAKSLGHRVKQQSKGCDV